VFVAMVYLQEAHADNTWPLGYGVQSHSNLGGRLFACRSFLDRNPTLKGLLHEFAVDAMDDRFLHKYGAWPERYFLAEPSGKVVWASSWSDDGRTMNNSAATAFQQVLSLV